MGMGVDEVMATLALEVAHKRREINQLEQRIMDMETKNRILAAIMKEAGFEVPDGSPQAEANGHPHAHDHTH